MEIDTEIGVGHLPAPSVDLTWPGHFYICACCFQEDTSVIGTFGRDGNSIPLMPEIML